jgi:hypothetical protein
VLCTYCPQSVATQLYPFSPPANRLRASAVLQGSRAGGSVYFEIVRTFCAKCTNWTRIAGGLISLTLQALRIVCERKGKGKGHPRTGFEDPEGDVQFYSFYNLGARWGGWSTSRPGRLTPGKDPLPIV